MLYNLSTRTAARNRVRVDRVLDHLRRAGVPGQRLLCSPLANGEFLRDADGLTPLCHWGIFNPFGPIMEYLFLVPVNSAGLDLLYFQSLSPFSWDDVVLGAVSAKRREGDLPGCLADLFARNGSPEYPFVLGLPTYVFPAASSRFDLKNAFLHALKAKQELYDDMLAAAQTLEQTSENPEGGATGAPWTGSSSTPFLRWWNMISARDHVRDEFAAISGAWDSVIACSKLPKPALPFEVPLRSFKRFGDLSDTPRG